MELNIFDDLIKARNGNNKPLLEIAHTDNSKTFLNNWYFLNKYSETNKFENAFAVNYI